MKAGEFKIEVVRISKVKPHPNNPRVIRDAQFKKLVESIKDFPEMLHIRPIVINENFEALGGNQRLKAATEAGLKEIPVILASSLTPEQQKEFMIKDNNSSGEWDFDALQSDWGDLDLERWGLELPSVDLINYGGKNQEIDVNSINTDMEIKLKFSEADYWRVKEKLQSIGDSPESAILKILFDE